MKKILLALLVLLVFTSGCGNHTHNNNLQSEDSLQLTDEPKYKDLDLGNVTMLFGGARLRMTDAKRSEPILTAISERLFHDRGARMTFKAICDINLTNRLHILVAAGTPPEICLSIPKIINDEVSSNNNNHAVESIYPKSLNSSLDQYGMNLRQAIPQYMWDLVTVNGNIMEIPQVKINPAIPVLNECVLIKQGWSVPNTIEQFERQLELAKDLKINPVISSKVFYSSMTWLQASKTSTILQDGNKPIHYLASKPYLSWLQQQRRWIENGWLVNLNNLSENDLYPDAEKWLCTEMSLDVLSNTPNVVVLPPLSDGADGPGYLPTVKSPLNFESYARPEALVILFDWMISAEPNNRLISIGEEGKDYRMVNDTEYEWIDGPSWPGTDSFIISDIFKSPHLLRQNSKAYEQAIDVFGRYSQKSASSDLPEGAINYRMEGSRLDSAVKDEMQYNALAMNARNSYLDGMISLSGYQTVLKQNDSLIEDYIKLTEEVKSGNYNIWGDVYQPET